MSSSQVTAEENQQDIIRSLKEEQQHQDPAATHNGDAVTSNGGVHTNGVMDEVDGIVGSKDHQHIDKQPEPTTQHEDPATNSEERAVNHDEPAVNHDESAANHVESAASHDEPAVNHVEPAANHDEPAVNHVEPGVSHEEPAVSREEPAVNHEEPAVKQEEQTPKQVEIAPKEEDAARSPRADWFKRRQLSQEMKKEVETHSRPTISKASMSTSVDEKSVRGAYEDVRSDTTDTEWAVFKFQDQNVVCSASGVGFDKFRSNFAEDDRAFGFIRIQMGDEMSKRQKFVFLTWVGPNVSVIRRAKMSIDKAMVKNIVKTFAVELQLESLSEINEEYFREQLARAGGANYGTGVRE